MTERTNVRMTRMRVIACFNDTALLRLLGVVRRRGFCVRSVEANVDGTGRMNVSLALESDRPVDVLIRQIGRLIGVEDVRVEPAVASVAVA